MIDLDWQDFYEIGVDFIDRDHKKILTIMQNLREAIIDGDLDKCSSLSDSLIKEAKNHFTNEEVFLEKVKYPGLKEHTKYHGELLLQAKQIKKTCDFVNREYDLMQCFDAMEQFLLDDILNSDLEFISFLEYEGHIKRKL